MKVINAFEFSEMLQTAPGISNVDFYVHPANVMTGDHVIPLFFYQDDGGETYVVENLLGKSPRLVPIKDVALGSNYDIMKQLSVMGEAYFYTAIMRYSSVEALQAAQERYDTQPIVEFVKESQNALKSAEWVTVPQLSPKGTRVSRKDLDLELSKPNAINLSLIKFYYNGDYYNVIGKGFREEVMLELIRYDAKEHNAYFSGIVAGKPIYQRVKLEEVSFRGDLEFMDWVNSHNFDNGDAGHGLWWIRHMGVSLHAASNSLTIKNPHLSVRGIVKKIPDSYDTINNRTVIL